MGADEWMAGWASRWVSGRVEVYERGGKWSVAGQVGECGEDSAWVRVGGEQVNGIWVGERQTGEWGWVCVVLRGRG